MLEMGELSMERFRGIFKLTYNGDAHIVLQTKVQVSLVVIFPRVETAFCFLCPNR